MENEEIHVVVNERTSENASPSIPKLASLCPESAIFNVNSSRPEEMFWSGYTLLNTMDK